ncbi:MAG: methylenetetrahydrofolate reductase [Mesorhizobium sp.]|nr:methylenetetrahydrofolate reductase [Mesorhizobium sp.]MCO5162486.1 methylenetetrahydrofolate reductase [Mesorhizobium sp.]
MNVPRSRDEPDRCQIAASIEMAPKQAIDAPDLPELFPAGARVYLADLGGPDLIQVAAARRLRGLGYEPVPHLAARRIASVAALEERLAALRGEAGVADILVVGGGLARPVGSFASSLSVLETGLLERYGIRKVGVAGHPEGSPDFSERVAIEALRLKQAFGERTGAEVRIVTQFGFDPDRAIAWANELREHGVDLPVHLGVAGPAKLTTLLKYAAMCGIGNSIGFLKKRALSLGALASNQSPETIVAPIEAQWRGNPSTPIEQVHVFPFGGIGKAAQWLVARGSWDDERTLSPASAAR